MPPLIEKWNILKDTDKDLFPLLEVNICNISYRNVCSLIIDVLPASLGLGCLKVSRQDWTDNVRHAPSWCSLEHEVSNDPAQYLCLCGKIDRFLVKEQVHESQILSSGSKYVHPALNCYIVLVQSTFKRCTFEQFTLASWDEVILNSLTEDCEEIALNLMVPISVLE